MCKRLLWGVPLLALVLGVSPALAWHPHHYYPYPYGVPVGGTSMSFSTVGVQSFAVPSAYSVPAASFGVPVPYSLGNPVSFGVPVTSFSVVTPVSFSVSQSAPASNAQAVDLLNLLNVLRQVSDVIGGGGGGGGSTAALATRVSNVEKRLQVIENQLKIKPKSPSSGKSGLPGQFHGGSGDDQGESFDVQASSTTDPIQALLDAMQAAKKANDAQQKAARDAAHELDYRISVLQDQLNDMKALRDQLKPKENLPLPKPENK
jgi:hypothetical protein